MAACVARTRALYGFALARDRVCFGPDPVLILDKPVCSGNPVTLPY